MFLMYLLACRCGSIIRGHRLSAQPAVYAAVCPKAIGFLLLPLCLLTHPLTHSLTHSLSLFLSLFLPLPHRSIPILATKSTSFERAIVRDGHGILHRNFLPEFWDPMSLSGPHCPHCHQSHGLFPPKWGCVIGDRDLCLVHLEKWISSQFESKILTQPPTDPAGYTSHEWP